MLTSETYNLSMSKEKKNEQRIQMIIDRIVDNRIVFGSSICLKTPNLYWCGRSGDFRENEPYFIASVTKLFVTTVILKLRQNDKISLDDKISKYLSAPILEKLHYINGTEYSSKISVRQLLAHTSGIPDYFQQKGQTRKSLEQEIISGNDQSWTFEDAITRSKAMKPLFNPGQKNRAHYSDTNYQLLGKIIEELCQEDLKTVLDKEIFQPLGLKKTYLYSDALDRTPKKMYYKQSKLDIPKSMSSFGADGGIVSTSEEMVIFLEAFFNGKLFPVQYLQELQQWNKIFYPLQSGVGIHRFKVPWIFSPFKSFPELIGHSGLSGAFAFYCPSREIYLAGTVNQVDRPGTSFKLMIRILHVLI